MDQALSGHAFPFAVLAEAFGCRAAPEEGGFFVDVGWVGEVFGGFVFHFVHVVPRTWIEDVIETRCPALAEDGEEALGDFERGGGEVESVEVGKIGLMAGVEGLVPVPHKLVQGMRFRAGQAERLTI